MKKRVIGCFPLKEWNEDDDICGLHSNYKELVTQIIAVIEDASEKASFTSFDNRFIFLTSIEKIDPKGIYFLLVKKL